MRCIILALAIAIVFVPRGTQNKSPHNSQQNTNRNQKPTQASVATVAYPNTARGNQEEASGVANAQSLERILFPTPVRIKSPKDIWDKALVLLTAALVVVAGVQILFLWRTVQATSDNARAAQAQAIYSEVAAKSAAENAEAANANARAVEAQNDTMRETLKVIERQTGLLERQTKANEENIEMIIAKERPRIRLSPNTLKPGGAWGAGCAIINSGPTDAYVKSFGLRFIAASSRTIAVDYDKCYSPEDIAVVHAGHAPAPERLAPLEPDVTLPEDQIEKLKGGQLFLHFYGFIEYTGIYARPPWRTAFHVYWQAFWGKRLDVSTNTVAERWWLHFWKPTGAPEENCET
ncbi:MAG TPA: hypothetical protein VGX94_15625 [Terriglobia bacterium]|nr:hypothetical protein [Terriglobia bacterium]